MNRPIVAREVGELIALAALAFLAAFALAAVDPGARPHTHDGGRTWHAHPGTR